MLKIRLSRTGKKGQPSFSVVVQEHTSAIKGKFISELGSYKPALNPKEFKVDIEKVKEWIAKGAQPSDTLAVLLKKEGMDGMDKYIGDRSKKRKSKKAPAEEAPKAAPAAAAPAAAALAETPAPAEKAPAPEAAPAEEAPKTEEAPAAEETPAPAEEAPKTEEAPAAEETPVEEPKA